MKNNKLIVILGPTACGKTRLATGLAAKFGGEIVSADSRQVYRGMDVGTGKDLADYQVGKKQIPYHLIDIISPKSEFNVAKYQHLAYQAIDGILRRGKVPFLVGGTGLYLDAVIGGYVFSPAASADLAIREKLSALPLPRLLSLLKETDPKTYKIIDKKNRRRIERALEIYFCSGRPKSARLKNKKPDYDILILGIKFPLEEIYRRIDSRLESRLQEGMIKEVETLRQSGVSWKRLDEFGLEYRWVAAYLRGKISHESLIAGLKNAIHHFAKRQLTWFKRNKAIKWVDGRSDAEELLKEFLN